MPKIKPNFDGSNQDSGFYQGPPPVPGTYRGTVKKMGLAEIKNGPNAGQNRIALLLEIGDGKYKGAGVLHSLNLTAQSAWAVNQFLDALTDGSERQRKGLRELFWQKGFDVANEADGKMGQQFISIGGKFKPIGKPVAFVTKMDSYEGNPKAAVDRFVVPVEGGNDAEDEAAEEDSLDGLSEFAAEDSPAAETAETEESPTEDADDPWS